jgi:hypothetical protein
MTLTWFELTIASPAPKRHRGIATKYIYDNVVQVLSRRLDSLDRGGLPAVKVSAHCR